MVARRTRPRKVLAFTASGPETPSSRLRILAYRDRFRREGVRFAVYEEEGKGLWRGLSNLYRFLTADVFLVQKRAFRLGRLWLARLLKKRIVFDIDEATFVDQDTGREKPAALRALRRFVRHCHLIVVCNRYLKERLTRPDQRVLTLLTIPLETPPAKPQRIQGLPRLGWIGTAAKLPYLESLDEMLCALQTRYPFELVVIGPPGGHADLCTRHRYIQWEPELERKLAQRFDVGLLPLPDDDRARGECGYKLLQLQSCGLPAVASRAGSHGDLIEHGVTGLLASDEREWHDCLELLLENPSLVTLMSSRILERYAERYSAERSFQQLYQGMCELVRTKPRPLAAKG